MACLSSPPRVLVCLSTAGKSDRDKLKGIFAHIRRHAPWNVRMLDDPDGEGIGPAVRRWRPQGVIISHLPGVAGLLRGLRVPTVVMDARGGYGRAFRRAWFITCDSRAIARCAAGFLVGQGFASFACIADRRAGAWSMERARLFRARLRELGRPCRAFVAHGRGAAGNWELEQQRTIAWLRDLAPGTAVFASSDRLARDLLELCQIAGIEVPERLAVLGCDNDDLICEPTSPPLSSIEPDFETCGRSAAELLDRLMAGEDGDPRTIVYGERRIVVRDSSRLCRRAVDPRVRQGTGFIRLNSAQPIRVADVARHMRVSRRTAELLFRRFLERSIGEEIQAVRLERARRFLTETALPVTQICSACGYRNAAHAMRTFRRSTGLSMGSYRLRQQAEPIPPGP